MGNSDFSVSTRHSKNILNRLDTAIQYLLERLPQVTANIDLMKKRHLSPEEINQLVRYAAEIRLNKPFANVNFTRNRAADFSNDLWTVFNSVQENTIRGGLKYYDIEAKRYKKTRKLTSIDTTIKLNKTLWNQAIALAA